jgi:phosphoesterase RecJ-like protein
MFDNTSPRTLKLTAFLWENNADVGLIHSNLAKRREQDVRLLGYVLLNYQKTDKINYFYFSKKVQKKLNLKPNDSQRVKNALANIGDSKIWIFFTDEDNQIKGSLRSNGPKINNVAAKFNGGGHEKASGFVLKNKHQIQDVIDECLKVI